MADFVFNRALGRIAEFAEAGDLRLLLLKGAAADAVHKDLATVAAVLAEGATDEADFTNYARVELDNVQVDVDNAGDAVNVRCDNVTFADAGGASNNNVTDAIIFLFGTDDSDSIPLVQLDAEFVTDGNTVMLEMHQDGFFGAS
jgi:hypothetical protein